MNEEKKSEEKKGYKLTRSRGPSGLWHVCEPMVDNDQVNLILRDDLATPCADRNDLVAALDLCNLTAGEYPLVFVPTKKYRVVEEKVTKRGFS